MNDPQGDKKGGVPSVPQVSYRAERPAWQLPFPRIRGVWWIVIALLTIGAVIGGAIWGIDPYPGYYLAVSSHNYSTIALDRVNCVSVDDVTYDVKNFSDPGAVRDVVGIRGGVISDIVKLSDQAARSIG
jgi:hypothetical protein